MSRLNIVIGADISALKKGFDDAVKIVAEGSKGMDSQVGAAAKNIQDRLEALASKRPTARVVRELQTLAMEARNLGPEFKTMADKFVRAAGEMQDNIGDTRAEIAYFASDTRRLDAVIGGAQAMAAGFGVVQGSMAAMGMEGENLQKTMAKVQGVMVVLNSLQTIQKLLLDESALKTGILALANTSLSASISTVVASMGAMRVAFAALGIGAIITTIGFLAVRYSDTAEAAKKAAKEQEKWNNISKDTAENFKSEYDKIGPLIAVLNNANTTYKERVAAVAKIQETYPDFLKNQNLEKLGAEGLSKATADLTQEIYKSAKAKAAYNAISDISAKMFEVERKKASDQLYWQGQIDKLYAQSRADLVANAKTSMEVNAKKFDQQIKGYQNEISQIQKYVKANDLSAESIVKSNEKVKKSNEEVKQGKSFEAALVIPKFEIRSDKFEQQQKELNKIRFESMWYIIPEIDVSKFEASMKTTMEEVNRQFEQMIESIVVTFADSLGKLIAGEDGVFKDFGKQALLTIAAFMRQVGEALIATAIASDAFKKLLLTQPLAAAAAGVALVAGSAIIKSKLEQGPQFKAFADGGIVYGPTLGLMGEYPGASSNPEVIAPLNKLKDIIGSGSGSDSAFIASTKISGRDLAIVLEKYQTNNSRG